MRILRLFHLESRQSLTRDLCCCNRGVTLRLYDFRYRLLTVSWALVPVFNAFITLDPSRPRQNHSGSDPSLNLPSFVGERRSRTNANIRFDEIFILSELQLRKRGIKIKRRIFHHITKSSVSGCLNITN